MSVVICNGMQEKAIKSIVAGRKIGTFFTNAPTVGSAPVETLAENGKRITYTFFTSLNKGQTLAIHNNSIN